MILQFRPNILTRRLDDEPEFKDIEVGKMYDNASWYNDTPCLSGMKI